MNSQFLGQFQFFFTILYLYTNPFWAVDSKCMSKVWECLVIPYQLELQQFKVFVINESPEKKFLVLFF